MLVLILHVVLALVLAMQLAHFDIGRFGPQLVKLPVEQQVEVREGLVLQADVGVVSNVDDLHMVNEFF